MSTTEQDDDFMGGLLAEAPQRVKRAARTLLEWLVAEERRLQHEIVDVKADLREAKFQRARVQARLARAEENPGPGDLEHGDTP